MKIKTYILLFIFSFISFELISQNSVVIENLKRELNKHTNEDTLRVQALNDLAWELSFYDFRASSAYCSQALNLSYILNYDNGRAEAYNVLGNNARSLNNIDSAFLFLGKALAIRKKQGNKTKQAAVLLNIANIYYQEKKYSDAIVKYSECIKLANENNAQKVALVALTNQAETYRYIGMESKALKALQHALAINKNLKDSLQEPYLYSTMAALLQQMGDISAASINAKKALSLLDKHPDVFLKIAVLNNLGSFYRELNKPDSALSYFRNAIVLEEENEDSLSLSTTNTSIALLYQRQGQWDMALRFSEKARNISFRLKDTVSFYNATLVMADNYIQKRNYKKALALALEVEEMVIIGNNKKSLFEMYDTFASIYKGLNQQEKRAQALEKVIAYRDSVLTDENYKISAKLNVELDVYGKEKEIELLSKSAQLQEVELARQKSARNFITGIAVLFGLIVLVIIFFYNKIRKSKIIINKQKDRVEAQNQIISNQKQLVEEKQKEVLDSIHYAKRIQQSLLPTEKYIHRIIGNLKN
ncbi:MAG: protein serine/threonine phosphatase [Bacteroidetes bacterium]|nr:protein serine/threonine phosphatase [Bacteroidota bacterium]